jgi:hypothetical protein
LGRADPRPIHRGRPPDRGVHPRRVRRLP